eukprot:SAG31_NODE_42241_length_272_cov_0.901734_1_plen_70_part_10
MGQTVRTVPSGTSLRVDDTKAGGWLRVGRDEWVHAHQQSGRKTEDWEGWTVSTARGEPHVPATAQKNCTS